MAANPAELGPKAARWQCTGPGCAAARAAGGRALLDADSRCCICKAPRPRAADPGAVILQHRALLPLRRASPHPRDPQSPGIVPLGVGLLRLTELVGALCWVTGRCEPRGKVSTLSALGRSCPWGRQAEISNTRGSISHGLAVLPPPLSPRFSPCPGPEPRQHSAVPTIHRLSEGPLLELLRSGTNAAEMCQDGGAMRCPAVPSMLRVP